MQNGTRYIGKLFDKDRLKKLENASYDTYIHWNAIPIYIFVCFVISYLLPSLFFFFAHKLHILVTIHGYILDITKTILSEKEKKKSYISRISKGTK